jgi:hypothetical protein
VVVGWFDWFVFTVPSGFELLGLLEGQNEENRKRDRLVNGRLRMLGWGETWIRASQLKAQKWEFKK